MALKKQTAEELVNVLAFFVNSGDVLVACYANHFDPKLVKVCQCGGCLLQRRIKDGAKVLKRARAEMRPKRTK